MVKSLPGLGLIAAIVGVAFLINDFQPAVSPLALCVAFGFAVANFGRWPSFAAAGTSLASKKLMRIGVALLGARGRRNHRSIRGGSLGRITRLGSRPKQQISQRRRSAALPPHDVVIQGDSR